VVQEIRVRGVEGIYLPGPDGTTSLQWIEGGGGFVVSTHAVCSTDTLTTRDVLVRVAESLRGP
jgi:hypothetical protein